MRRTKIKTLPLGLLMALGGLTGCNRVGDQYCDTDIKVGDLDYYEVCPYGEEAEVQYTPPVCTEGHDSNTAPFGCENISWNKDIWPLLTKPAKDGGGACSQGGCHQNGEGRGVKLTENALQAWDVLSNYRGSQENFYISKDDNKSWILCNLKGLHPAGGVTMPPGEQGLNELDYGNVKQWVECGQRLLTPLEEMNPPGE